MRSATGLALLLLLTGLAGCKGHYTWQREPRVPPKVGMAVGDSFWLTGVVRYNCANRDGTGLPSGYALIADGRANPIYLQRNSSFCSPMIAGFVDKRVMVRGEYASKPVAGNPHVKVLELMEIYIDVLPKTKQAAATPPRPMEIAVLPVYDEQNGLADDLE